MSLSVQLPVGSVSITGGDSIAGITAKGSDFQFGLIDQVANSRQNAYSVGDSVLFKLSDAVIVEAGGTQYCIVNENNIIFRELIVS